MSVLKMIIADDRHYVCGEPHGSTANLIYAACAKNPGSLNELDAVIGEFGERRRLQADFGWAASLDFTPVDAGLIIIDLAKKWIFAEDTYFGASRRGSYHPVEPDARSFAYEFSKKWHFVSEAKWFNYLFSCDLQPFFKRGMTDAKMTETEAIPKENFAGEPALPWEDGVELLASSPVDSDDEPFDDEAETWDEGMADIHIKYANRFVELMDFEPQNDVEARDLQTLEHILRYEQQADICQHQIKKAREEIFALQIELQAAENLWKRTAEPRWERKFAHFQLLIKQREKHIAGVTGKQDETTAMAAEFRTLGSSGKFHEALKSWRDED